MTSVDLARARLLRDQPSIVDDLNEIGRRRLQSRDLDGAQVALAKADQLATKVGDEIGSARARIGMAEVAHWRGDSMSVIELIEVELPRARTAGADVYVAYVLCMLGEALLAQDRPAAAAEAFRDAQRVAEQRRDWKEQANAVYGFGRVAYHEGRFQEASEHWSTAAQVYARHGHPGGVAQMQHWLSMAAGAQHQTEAARQFALDSIRDYEKAGRPDLADDARGYLAEVDEFIAGGGFGLLSDQM